MVKGGGISVRDWLILKQNILLVEVDFFTLAFYYFRKPYKLCRNIKLIFV